MDELERIKQKKLREMMGKAKTTDPKEVGEPKEEWSSIPVEFTDATFKGMVQKYPSVVVDCWAEWCGPCKMVAPVVDELAREYIGKVLFGKLNVDSNPRIAVEYRIMSIPTLLVFKNGQLVDQIVGFMPRNILEPRIVKHI
ncbi:MAG: thioredoxin [Candidatus Bathyarchaeota archaeon]